MPEEQRKDDPTALTTQMVQREVETLERMMVERFAGVRELIVEKMAMVERQFELVERMRIEQKKDTNDAVDAALTAQKEAVKEQTTAFALATTKSESAMTKQIEQVRGTFEAAIKGVTDLLNDVKDRQTRAESLKLGGQELMTAKRGDSGQVYLTLGVIVASAGLIISFVNSLNL